MCLLPWLISSLTLICGECRRWGEEREAFPESESEGRYSCRAAKEEREEAGGANDQ